MKPPEYYRGREQTYAKHFFLEQYLERVAWNIFSFSSEFVYVDGFSGPWQAADESYQDTSFAIALNQLRKIRTGYREQGKYIRIRCLFNDNDPAAYENLNRFVDTVDDIEVKTLCRDFEDLIPDIVSYVGRSFSLIFIDPKGWTGFGLQKLQPLLRLRGEVIINFMTDFAIRFFEDPRPELATSFDPLFGGPGWNLEVDQHISRGETREEALLDVYCERVRQLGQHRHITSTRILKPITDRSYFHLVYGTNHWKGLVEFREVEKKAIDAQERAREVAKITHRVEQTGQGEMFGPDFTQTGTRPSEIERPKQLDAAYKELRHLLKTRRSIKYDSILGLLLERPMIWKSDVDSWLRKMRTQGEIAIPELTGRTRTPRPGYTIIWNAPNC